MSRVGGARLALAAAGAVVALAGCGDKSGGGNSAASDGPVRTATVERTTRVEVLQKLGHKGRAAFDPAGIYAREGQGVVTIISTGLGGGLGGSGNGGSGLGSGFVLSGEGEIATNAHVITSGEGKAVRKARAVFVRFADGNQVPAKIIGFDPFSDVGLIKVDPTNLTLRPLPLGHATALDVGEPVAAIGSPFGEEQSLSVGVVSALHRSISSLTGFQTGGAIQTDAAINRGNSGGPLLNSKGEVLGINSQIRTESGDGSGVGFAVSVDTVRRSLAQLRKTGTARYAYLGVSSARIYPQLAQRFGLPPSGAWVQTVVDGGPAGKAGLKAGAKQVSFQEQSWKVGGDVVTRVGNRKVVNEDDLADALTAYRPGDKAGLEVIRDGQRKTISVTLGERPVAAPDRG